MIVVALAGDLPMARHLVPWLRLCDVIGHYGRNCRSLIESWREWRAGSRYPHAGVVIRAAWSGMIVIEVEFRAPRCVVEPNTPILGTCRVGDVVLVPALAKDDVGLKAEGN